jgi:cullin-associated NEDD8-dissociated protein 1
VSCVSTGDLVLSADPKLTSFHNCFKSPLRLLRSQLPAILKQVLKQLNTKSLPTKQSGFTLLRELSAVLSGGLDAQATVICARVSDTLSSHGHNTSSPLIIEALCFLGQFFANHPSDVWEKELGRLVPQVVNLTKDKNQKTSVEAFVVISELAKSIRPSRNEPFDGGLVKFVEEPYRAAVEVLKGNLADDEVRIKAIETLAVLLGCEGDVLAGEYETCLGVLSNSVGNETLRASAIRAIGDVAGAQLCSGEFFGRWLIESLGTVTGVLKKGSRSVKTVSFECLGSILIRLGGEIPTTSATSLISDLSPFIAAEDLQNFPPTLTLLTLLLRTQPASKPSLEALIPTIYTITRSPLLVGPALDAVLAFFAGLVSLEPDASLRIIPELIKPFEGASTIPDATSGELHAFRTVAKCVGAIVAASPTNSAGVVAEFAKQIEVRLPSLAPPWLRRVEHRC